MPGNSVLLPYFQQRSLVILYFYSSGIEENGPVFVIIEITFNNLLAIIVNENTVFHSSVINVFMGPYGIDFIAAFDTYIICGIICPVYCLSRYYSAF